jgi:DNA transposition AAA+ family ATPase
MANPKNNKATARNLTDSQKQDIVGIINGYIERSSGNKLAAASGVSSGTISQMINNEWLKISDAMWLKIKTFIVGTDWTVYEEASGISEVYQACEDAKQKQRMVAVSAYTGAGKTTAFKFYKNDHPDNTHYICCNFLMKPKDLLHEIAKCFLVEITKKDTEVLAEIVKKVSAKEHYGSLLILDDFAKMGDGCYRMLQLIYDMTEYKLGIVVAGTETLSEYVTRSATKNKMGFREIKRRLGVMRDLPLLTHKEIDAVCELNNLTDAAIITQIKKAGVTDFGTLKQMVMDSI